MAKLLRLLGTGLLLWLGTHRRALNAWIEANVATARSRFGQLKVVQDRSIALNLPVKINGMRVEQLWPAVAAMLGQPAMSLLIAGLGVQGKPL